MKKGSRSKVLLKNAPSPVIVIAGKKVNARIVIDISTNRLYKYNELGKAEVVTLSMEKRIDNKKACVDILKK